MVRGLRRRRPRGAKASGNEESWIFVQADEDEEPEEDRRKFSHAVKEACWNRAAQVPGRDPQRWRLDALGNVVFRKLGGCSGCLCYDFDHIVPFSKGGKSSLENCQVLQATVNHAKADRENVSTAELKRRSARCRLSDRDMDVIELSTYGNIHKDQNISAGCRIQ